MRNSVKFVKENLGKDLIVAEIGVLDGTHALELLQNLPIHTLYLIDPWIAYVDSIGNFLNQEKMDENMKSCMQKVRDYPNVKIMRMDSYSSSLLLKNTQFDFVYLDGVHDRPYLDLDLKHWFPLIKEGGVIATHDYGNYSFVQSALKYFVHNEAKDYVIKEEGEDGFIHKKL